MRNPNGYGSVVKLSGNRRRPFVARKTVGWDIRGYPKYEAIGYYAKRSDALVALAEYNRNPYDLDLAKITTKELFARWEARANSRISDSTLSSMRSAFKMHIAPLHNVQYKAIKAYHMQEIIDNCGRGYGTQGLIRNVFYHLDLYAYEYEIITTKYSELVHTAPASPSTKSPFTRAELDVLWSNAHALFVDIALILVYTGFRISELLSITPASINIAEQWIKGGSKTDAGRDRIVPIHPLIKNFVEARLDEGNDYLITHNGRKIEKRSFYDIWRPLMSSLGMSHTPHECRHTFRSLLDSAGANKRCIDLLMGHTSKDVGERIYTHKTLAELREALLLVTQ